MGKSRNLGDKDTSIDQSTESTVKDPIVATRPPQNNASGTSMSQLAASKKSSGFTDADFSHLTENENYRYANNSKRIGHAVITRDKNGDKVALQYNLPQGNTSDTPTVCQLNNIEEIARYGMTRHRAIGDDGKTWYAKRYDHARIKLDDDDAASVDFAYFSEEEIPGKEPFWGSKNEKPKFRNNLSAENRKDFEAEKAEIKPVVKGGHEMHVDEESVRHRDLERTRKPDQNTLMGESARDAYEHFFSAMEDVLSPELKKILQRAFRADIRKTPENQYRPEWLHAYGFSLTPVEENPQRKDNLGAAGKWANTEMMVLERIAKWFALNQGKQTNITLKTMFDMLHDSELVSKIHFEVNIEMQSRFVRFIQDLDAFKEYPVFRKASDLAQATGISYAMLSNQDPILRDKITGASIRAQSASSKSERLTNSSATSQKEAPITIAETSNLTPLGDNAMPKSQFPTHVKHQKSIVQLLVTSHAPDYEEPWNGTHVVSSTSSGFVIEHEGEKYILTNAHCVQNNIRTQVRLANDRDKKFNAVPICVSYQSDLALLKVKSATFQKIMQPVSFGDMVAINDEVQTIGFPMGGDEISVTKGIVSRIEVSGYSMSGGDMLQAQVDAAINPGNSGGPVFCGDRVVGVAFQGMDAGQNLGYIIPTPIVKHFLTEVFNGKPYRGFPILPVVMDTLENKWQRKFYGMSPSQTGVFIPKTSPLGDAHVKLKDGDILLEIDGHKISNQGTVDIPGVGNCLSLLHLTHMKFIGDSVHLSVLRKNAATGIAEVHAIDVVLDHIPNESEVVLAPENDKMPTYYINSGMVFVPVSHNYLEGPGSELGEVTFIDRENGSYNITDLPKKNPDHQLVAINTVFDCKSTQGYEGLVNNIVTKVNGKMINNLRELIEVMESNTNDVHLIEKENKTYVLKNLSTEEMSKIMRAHKIAFDRSEDLRPDYQPNENFADSSDSDSDSSDDNEVKVAPLPASASSSSSSSIHARSNKRRIVQDDEDETVIESSIRSLVGKDGCMPGQRRFMGVVDAMEKHYKHAPQDEAEIDWDALSDDDSDEDAYVPPSKATRGNGSSSSKHKFSVLTGGHSLFASKGHQRDESSSSEEEVVQAPKRARK